ncbi:MAG: hypothetical protein IT162_00525 [Bryobacterales bacterium]|nr:hypothetical protein [Bryobacterales bacterium]
MKNSLHNVDLVAFARERLNFQPNPAQLRALDLHVRQGILNCSRQWGKSTTVSVRAVHHAFYTPGSLTVVASPTGRQSAEFVRKAGTFLRQLGIRPRGDGDNEISLLLPNESRIIGLPGDADNIRGFSSVGLLLIDEASRVPDELYHALSPMTAAHPNPSIWLLSTPNGRQGFFYEEWQKGEAAEWTRISSPVTECPHITPRHLDRERNRMPDAMFRQEYLCEFTTADLGYFDPATIDNAFLKLGESGPARSRYYLGFDVGQARDYSAIAILERRIEFTGEVDAVTFERRTRTRIVVHHLERIPLRTPYPDVVARVRELKFHEAYSQNLEILMDSTGVGAAVRDMLNAAHLKCRVTGITLTGGERVLLSPGLYHVPRHDLLINLRVLLEKQMLEIAATGPQAEALRAELYRWGQRSAHDDLVFAVALAAWKAGGQPLHQLHGPNPIPLLYPEVRK